MASNLDIAVTDYFIPVQALGQPFLNPWQNQLNIESVASGSQGFIQTVDSGVRNIGGFGFPYVLSIFQSIGIDAGIPYTFGIGATAAGGSDNPANTLTAVLNGSEIVICGQFDDGVNIGYAWTQQTFTKNGKITSPVNLQFSSQPGIVGGGAFVFPCLCANTSDSSGDWIALAAYPETSGADEGKALLLNPARNSAQLVAGQFVPPPSLGSGTYNNILFFPKGNSANEVLFGITSGTATPVIYNHNDPGLPGSPGAVYNLISTYAEDVNYALTSPFWQQTKYGWVLSRTTNFQPINDPYPGVDLSMYASHPSPVTVAGYEIIPAVTGSVPTLNRYIFYGTDAASIACLKNFINPSNPQAGLCWNRDDSLHFTITNPYWNAASGDSPPLSSPIFTSFFSPMAPQKPAFVSIIPGNRYNSTKVARGLR